jgi:hypothetical protein
VPSQPQDLNTLGIHFHTLSNRLSAGGDWLGLPRHLDKAQAAGSGRLGFIMKRTQVRDIDIVIERYPEKVFAFAGFDLLAVDF